MDSESNRSAARDRQSGVERCSIFWVDPERGARRFGVTETDIHRVSGSPGGESPRQNVAKTTVAKTESQ